MQKPPATTPGLGAVTAASANVAAIASRIRRKPRRRGDRPIDFIKRGVVIFCFFLVEVGLLNALEVVRIGAREGSAYRGKAAIFRIMESTMTDRGFLRPGRSALV